MNALSEAFPRIEYRWPTAVDESLGRQVIGLYDDCARGNDILGYAEELTNEQADKVLQALRDAVRKREKHFFGVYFGDRLTGMALLTPNSLPNCKHIVEWSKGVIHSEFQGRGILKGAIAAMAQHCLEMGWEIVTLDVRVNTRSHRLWSAIGFREYGRLEDYARVNGSRQAGAFMFADVRDLLQVNIDRPIRG